MNTGCTRSAAAPSLPERERDRLKLRWAHVRTIGCSRNRGRRGLPRKIHIGAAMSRLIGEFKGTTNWRAGLISRPSISSVGEGSAASFAANPARRKRMHAEAQSQMHDNHRLARDFPASKRAFLGRNKRHSMNSEKRNAFSRGQREGVLFAIKSITRRSPGPYIHGCGEQM